MSALDRAASRRRTPLDVWRGFACVDKKGVSIAYKMLSELEQLDGDKAGITLADYASLEEWPREGNPFRNVVAEYLAVAREGGPSVEAGFLAVLTDMIAMNCQGLGADSGRYEDFGRGGAL